MYANVSVITWDYLAKAEGDFSNFQTIVKMLEIVEMLLEKVLIFFRENYARLACQSCHVMFVTVRNVEKKLLVNLTACVEIKERSCKEFAKERTKI